MNSKRIWTAALLAIAVVTFGAVPSQAASVYHKVFMKGSIIESSEEGIYLCIGSEDGAKSGQVLDVMRVSKVSGGSSKAGAKFKRTWTRFDDKRTERDALAVQRMLKREAVVVAARSLVNGTNRQEKR